MNKRRIHVLYLYIIIVVIVGVAAVLALFRLSRLSGGVLQMQELTEEYIASRKAISDMREASRFLTEQSREYTMDGQEEHLEAYLEEVRTTQRREHALEVLGEYQEDSESYQSLVQAVEHSNALAEIEMYAMRLASDAYGMDAETQKMYFGDVSLRAEDAALTAEEKHRVAVELLFDDIYDTYKDEIKKQSYSSMDNLSNNVRDRQLASFGQTKYSLNWVYVSLLLILAATLAGLIVTAEHVILPLNQSIGKIREHSPLPVRGSAEYAYLAEAYNKMLEKTQEHHEQLSFEAAHDELTRVYNRKVFEEKRVELADTPHAMLLVDVDYFKTVNDTYGHETGDRLLKTVAEALTACFRQEDYICRIGGDEFAVLMQHIDSSLQHVVQMKIQRVCRMLEKAEGLPPVTLSIGAAFSDENGNGDLFGRADRALYVVKEKGRNGFAFFEPSMGKTEAMRGQEDA